MNMLSLNLLIRKNKTKIIILALNNSNNNLVKVNKQTKYKLYKK